MKHLLLSLVTSILLLACANEPREDAGASSQPPAPEQPQVELPDNVPSADPALQEKIKNLTPGANNDKRVEIKGVNLTYPLRQSMVRKGQRVYQEKCASCHPVTGEKGPASSFAGLTQRREPAWIMNMLIYPDFKPGAGNTAAKKCWVRQEGNLLTIENARDFLEFARFNDGEE